MTTVEKTYIAEYQTTAAALALLREKYIKPFDVTTSHGMTIAKAARAEVRSYRTDLEAMRKEIKAPALERCRLIDAEAKRITAELLAIEEPIDAVIQAEERRKAEEKAARERAEAARVAALDAKVYAISTRILYVANLNAAEIRLALEEARAFDPDPDEFGERWPNAMKSIGEVRQVLETLLAKREELEARQAEEEVRLKAEREELARQQAELARKRAEEDARRQAEREEMARQQAAENARLQAERERQESELRIQREAQQRAEQESRQAREVEEARIRQERAELKAKQLAFGAESINKTKITGLSEIKAALAAGTITGPEAIDRAYELGFDAGKQAALHH